ncbi:MAG TPA: hypothetical protein VN698_07985 [Bacteroidia bacterium]|nr:hypothetical protein [Bacteroidia bacterium]
MQQATKFFFLLFIITKTICAQDAEINGLKMSYPRVYFKTGSTDYAPMPYSADSCFKYIAANIKDIKSFVIWRDSSESEQLSTQRIKKLKADLHKYTPAKIYIESMKAAQRVLQSSINKSNSAEQRQYLLSLNSVFDVYTTATIKNKPGNEKHEKHLRRLVWCGWRYGFHWK